MGAKRGSSRRNSRRLYVAAMDWDTWLTVALMDAFEIVESKLEKMLRDGVDVRRRGSLPILVLGRACRA